MIIRVWRGQTSVAVAIHDGQLTVENWLHVLMNPSWPYRLPHNVDRCLPNGIIHGRRSRCLVSAAGQAPGFRAEDCRSGNRLRDGVDSRTGFHRRHCLRHNAQIPTLKNAGGRGLLGKAIAVARTVLLVHSPGPKGSAKSVCAGNTLSRKYLADPQPQGTC